MSRRKGQPWKTRPHHRAFHKLSAPARRRAVDGFRANESTTAIAAAIAKDFGETIPVSSLNRYREWWDSAERPVFEAAEKTEELLAAFKARPNGDLEHVIRELLMAQRLTAMTEDRKPDPVKLGLLDIEERRLKLKEREVALREKALERKAEKAAGAVERELKRANAHVAPETMARIRQEIYGIPA